MRPRFGDVDGLRHINNCVVPMWFEQGREPFFRIFSPEFSINFEEWRLIMAHMDIDFVGQLRLGHDVEIRTYVAKLGRSSMTLRQEAWQNGVMGAVGHCVIVHYDFAAQSSVPLPGHIRAQLEQHLYVEESPA